eukprot:1145861-Pelagomonas_calceolata.AAC.12
MKAALARVIRCRAAQVQGTWACAGVLLASVPRWEEFSRSVPERELGAVMQTLATAFGQMAESVGLVMLLRCTCRPRTSRCPCRCVLMRECKKGFMRQPLPLQAGVGEGVSEQAMRAATAPSGECCFPMWWALARMCWTGFCRYTWLRVTNMHMHVRKHKPMRFEGHAHEAGFWLVGVSAHARQS